jgi:hypothetical protein
MRRWYGFGLVGSRYDILGVRKFVLLKILRIYKSIYTMNDRLNIEFVCCNLFFFLRIRGWCISFQRPKETDVYSVHETNRLHFLRLH